MRADYGDWEISADRANAVRRKLLERGVSAAQIVKVAGFGDTVPMPESEATNEINRRVTVLLNIHQAKKA
jgi:chemotaxis protein MotB